MLKTKKTERVIKKHEATNKCHNYRNLACEHDRNDPLNKSKEALNNLVFYISGKSLNTVFKPLRSCVFKHEFDGFDGRERYLQALRFRSPSLSLENGP